MSEPRVLRRVASGVFAAAVLLLGSATAAQADEYRIAATRVDVSAYPLVRIVASVTDATGRPAKGIGAADVTVAENGHPVTADVTLASDVAPVAVVIAIDTSGSMAGAMPAAISAATAFVQALGPSDRAAVVTFGTTTTIRQGLTSDRAALETAISAAAANGNTALYDALDRAVAIAADGAAGARPAVVLLTDGADTASAVTLPAVSAHVRAAGLPVFVVGLGDRVERDVLQTLAAASAGGRVLLAPTPADLLRTYDGLAEQLRSDLAIGYRTDASVVGVRDVAIEIRRDGTLLARTTIAITPPAIATQAPASPSVAPVEDLPVVIATAYPDAPLGIAILGMTAVAALVIGLYVADRQRSERRRARRLVHFVRVSGADEERSSPGRTTVVAMRSLHRASLPLRGVVRSTWLRRTNEWLLRAGEPWGLDALEFITLRVIAAVTCAAGLGIATFLLRPGLLTVSLAVLFGAFVGYAIPGVMLGFHERRRKRELSRALPGALDMLALSTGAGLTLDGSIAQVANRWQTALSGELQRYLAEIRVGRSRRDALHALAQRIDLNEMTHVTATILQADVLGVPIASVLREQSAELRRERRQHAEELARLAPVKMLFPMALLIFPALFVVILGPVVPVVLRAFAS